MFPGLLMPGTPLVASHSQFLLSVASFGTLSRAPRANSDAHPLIFRAPWAPCDKTVLPVCGHMAHTLRMGASHACYTRCLWHQIIQQEKLPKESPCLYHPLFSSPCHLLQTLLFSLVILVYIIRKTVLGTVIRSFVIY